MKVSGRGLERRIREGTVVKQDVVRRLAELAFGEANDCVRLALEADVDISGLDLGLLSEVRRSEKGLVEVKLMDRLKLLEQLAQLTAGEADGPGALLALLGGGSGHEADTAV